MDSSSSSLSISTKIISSSVTSLSFKSSQKCKNHSQQNATYFQKDQPWIKFCSICALNMALAGKKIQKDLSQSQFQIKMSLNSVINDFKQTLLRQQQGNTNFNNFLNKIQTQFSNQISIKIKAIDQYISALMKARQQLFGIYQKQVLKRVNNFYQKQGKCTIKSLQVKKSLDYIQSNFGNLMSLNQNQNSFMIKNQIQKWNLLIRQAKETVFHDYQLKNAAQKIQQAFKVFNTNYQIIQSKIGLQKLRQKEKQKEKEKQKQIIKTPTKVIKTTQNQILQSRQRNQILQQYNHQYRQGRYSANTNNSSNASTSINVNGNPQYDSQWKDSRPHLKLRSSSKKSDTKKAPQPIISLSTKRKSRQVGAIFDENHNILK